MSLHLWRVVVYLGLSTTLSKVNYMGYSTDFTGSFRINPPLKPEHTAYLQKFSDTRRVNRDETIAAKIDDPIRIAVGLPAGLAGGYTLIDTDPFGPVVDNSVVNYNHPPEGQPGLWCQWAPTDDGTQLEWNGAEKFYNYREWLIYLNEHFFQPWGYRLSGQVQWQGERENDQGVIIIDDGISCDSEGTKLIENEIKNTITHTISKG